MRRISLTLDAMNGVVVAYAVGLVNALLALLFSFGVNVSTDQRTAIITFVNASLVLIAHLAHRQAAKNPTPADVADAVQRGVLPDPPLVPKPSHPSEGSTGP